MCGDGGRGERWADILGRMEVGRGVGVEVGETFMTMIASLRFMGQEGVEVPLTCRQAAAATCNARMSWQYLHVWR